MGQKKQNDDTAGRDLVALRRALAEVVRLAPPPGTEFEVVDATERKRLLKAAEEAVAALAALAVELDLIALPTVVYNPADPATFAESIGNKLLLRDPVPLGAVVNAAFYGSGVYAIYYAGSFDAYRPIRGTGTPIYVGKADPARRDAKSPRDQGTTLWKRLREHADSIGSARNLDLADFSCRHLVVGSGWQVAAEGHLIPLFKPIWNKEMKVCQGLGKHGDDSRTRRNRRSAWDTLHPGRGWATDALDHDRTVEEIKADIVAHYKANPPRH
jgi:hypothetical protein